MDETDVCVVLVTAPDEDTARDLAHEMVARGAAACVNRVAGVRSTYRWEGEIHDDAEVLLVIKTSRKRVGSLRDLVQERHPYDVPEFLVVGVDEGSKAYLEWVLRATT